VWTTEDQPVAAGHGVEVAPVRWQAGFDELLGRVAGRFPRVEPRRRAKALVLGLLADLPRKNCWRIAEHAGDASPDGMQHLLARAVWDHDGVRDDLRADSLPCNRITPALKRRRTAARYAYLARLESRSLLTALDKASTAVCKHWLCSARTSKSGRGLLEQLPGYSAALS
jgi:DDE superfamily endonuclease